MLRAIGEGDFALFGSTHHAITQTLTPDFVEQGDLVGLPGIAHHIVQEAAIRAAVKIALRGDVVDGDSVPPGQDRQGDPFFRLPTHAQQWHQALKGERDIQIVTAHAAAAVPQQAVFAVTTVMPLRPHQQQ